MDSIDVLFRSLVSKARKSIKSQSTGRVFVDGSFKPGEQIVPVRWVEVGSQEAAIAVLRRYQSGINDWKQDETIKALLAGDATDSFFTALQAGGPFPAPVKGQTTAYWRPATTPTPDKVDLLDLTTDQLDAVMALTYTDCDADPAASPAWSRPGMQFDAKGTDGKNRHYYCTRATYTPGTTSGVGPAWHRFQKLDD